MEGELRDLRKSRRVEEKRIRNRIIDEYDSLVRELVKEIAIIQGRFREYQISNFNEIMRIMAESQNEQLGIMAQNMELPSTIREVSNSILAHQEQIDGYRQQNYELKMTILKIRSLYLMKEQALTAYFDRKVRKLTEDNKDCEEKLWDSYRDAEARERFLRKDLAKLQRNRAHLEMQNDNLQRQLREEQSKISVKASGKDDASSNRSHSSRSRRGRDSEKIIANNLGLNVDHLIQELANKTALVEELLQEKRDR